MKVRDLIRTPLKREVQRQNQSQSAGPAQTMPTNVNRLFEELWRSFNVPIGRMADDEAGPSEPNIDIRETDKEIQVLAELPGMEEADIEVNITDGMLSVAGERDSERESREGGYLVRERSVGRFERVVPLPDGLDIDAAQASFKNGLLTISIPKTKEAQAEVKRVTVKGNGKR